MKGDNRNVRPRGKFWLESEDGRYLMGPRTLRLLRAIEATGNLKAAAREAGFSYRAAWARLREVEIALGFPLARSRSGGEGGGGTRLTEEGKNFLQRYQRFLEAAEEGLSRAFREAFGE